MHSNTCLVSPEESQQLKKVVEQLRQVMANTNTLIAPEEVLGSVQQKLDECLELMKPHSGQEERAMGYYDLDYGDNLNGLQPYSPFIGEYNPLAPPMDCRVDGERLIGEMVLNELYEGPPNSVHGGVISGIYDQLLAMVGTLQGKAGPTAYLHIEYKQVTPLYEKVRFEAWIDRIEDKKIFVKGQCIHNDKLLSEAEALFINALL